MGVEHGGAVFGVILRADIPAFFGDLHHFHKFCLGVASDAFHAALLEGLQEIVVELEAVAVAFADLGRAVSLGGFRAGKELALVGSETHRASHVGDRFLLLHEVDHVIGCLGVHFGGVGVFEAEHVAGELDHHALHSEADAESRHVMLATPFQGGELTLDSALAEARGDDHAVHVAEFLVGVGVGELLGVDVYEIELVVLVGGAVHEGFGDRLVGVLELHIFTDQTDSDDLFGVLELMEESVPGGEVGFGARVGAGELDHHVVEVLLVHAEGHLIDSRLVEALDHGLGGDVAELADLAAHCCGEVFLRAEHEDVGLDADALEHLHAMLRGLCLQLLCGAEIRHVCEVDEEGVLAELPFELAHSLEERRRLDVADGSADFSDHEVIVAGVAEDLDVALDFVGDVRDDLHGLSEIVAAALLVDDALVDPACGDVVGAGCLDVGEALVVAEVEVGLVAVDGHVAFAVLVGVERARVDVDVGVELLDSDPVASAEQEARQRTRDDTFAKR